jgi:4Fe-4S ferredoxin
MELKANEIKFSLTIKDKTLYFERKALKERRKLTYDHEKCTGCGICADACPIKAIDLGPLGAISARQVESFKILINPYECTLCGICSGACIFNALALEINGKPMEPMRLAGMFLFSQEKCKTKDEEKKIICKDCEEACPQGAIKAKLENFVNTIERFEDKCIYCSSCQVACPYEAISVQKIFDGDIEIDQQKCQGCGVCWEICPTNSLASPKKEKPWDRPDKTSIDENRCNLCGACAKVCPIDAISVKRSKVRYSEENKPWTKFWQKAFEELKNV